MGLCIQKASRAETLTPKLIFQRKSGQDWRQEDEILLSCEHFLFVPLLFLGAKPFDIRGLLRRLPIIASHAGILFSLLPFYIFPSGKSLVVFAVSINIDENSARHLQHVISGRTSPLRLAKFSYIVLLDIASLLQYPESRILAIGQPLIV
jgi:hypothetical protein